MAKKTQAELEQAIKKYHVDRNPLTMRQTRLALKNSGLLSRVEETIANLPTDQRETAEIEWNYADRVYRNSEWIVNIASQLGLSESDIDDLFYSAYDL